MPDAADLFDRYAPLVLHYFRVVTGQPDLAEDLTQEVFLRVVRYVGAYREQGREQAWLFAIARTVLVDYQRMRHTRSLTISVEEAELPVVDPGRLVALGVAQAVRQLPRQDRELLALRELCGFTHGELSVMLGLTPGAVRTRLYRAKEAVRAMLPGRAAQWLREKE